mgnify:CR=1 FL=1
MIIFIESNTSGTGEYFYQLCKKKKIDFKFIVKSPHKYKWLKKPNFELSNTDDIQQLETKINEINKKKRIKFILSTSDQFVIMANELNKRFNIKCEDSDLLKTFKNKFECSKIMKKLNIFKRKSFVMKNDKDKIPKITFPCIIKPNSGTGSINVYKIDNLKNLKVKIKFFFKKKIEFVVEEYIDGQEYSLEVLFLDKKIIFEQLIEKQINDKDHYVESGHIIHSKFSSKILNIKKKILNKIKKFKMNKIFLHIEFKIDNNDKVEIIEINPRLAGGFIPILVKETCGIDLINYYIDLINQKIVQRIKKIKHKETFKIFFLIPQKSKKIHNITFSKKINRLVIQKKIYKDKVQNFKKYTYNFSDRLGHVIFKSKNITELRLLESLIKANIKYYYKR